MVSILKPTGLLTMRSWGLENGCLISTGLGGQHGDAWVKTEAKADHKPTKMNSSGLYSMCLDCDMGILRVTRPISGIIENRGKVQVHADGVVRSEWARIVHLFVPMHLCTKQQVATLHRHYKVPVTLTNDVKLAIDEWIDQRRNEPGATLLFREAINRRPSLRSGGKNISTRIFGADSILQARRAAHLLKVARVAGIALIVTIAVFTGKSIFDGRNHYTGDQAIVENAGAADVIASTMRQEITGSGEVTITVWPSATTFGSVLYHIARGEASKAFEPLPTRYVVSVDVQQANFPYGSNTPVWAQVAGGIFIWFCVIIACVGWSLLLNFPIAQRFALNLTRSK